MCIKLVTYQNYKKLHGQKNTKFKACACQKITALESTASSVRLSDK
jgi:hypothetical protein